ncbi:hypothetical protein [Cupriavidus sp. H18C1]|uniref:hypothetical protein n=1 Tax=Cupriavidus sp. H18C1 TaxID=3241601 RepID=UPI003BB8FBFE
MNHSQTDTARDEAGALAAGGGFGREGGAQEQDRGQDTAGIDHEHHRVAQLLARRQLAPGRRQRRLEQLRREHAARRRALGTSGLAIGHGRAGRHFARIAADLGRIGRGVLLHGISAVR